VKKKTKKIRFLTGIILGLIFGVFLILAFPKKTTILNKNSVSKISKKGTLPNPSESLTQPKKPCPLNGEMVKEQDAGLYPVAVMIENHTAARPQSGLEEAQLVYETVAEGGITRLMAIFACSQPDKVGPVRSARLYYIDWVLELNALYAHVGGNYDALTKIKKEKVLDMDQFRYGKMAFWRENNKGKAVEHTMYTSVKKLRNIASKNWDLTKSYQVWQFKEDAERTQGPAASSIIVDFSNDNYRVKWSYLQSDNAYLREQSQFPKIKAKNVIIQWTTRWPVVSQINEKSYDMKTIGSGKAEIYLDGVRIEGTWKKDSKSERTRFYDTSGQEIKFNRGLIWIEVVYPPLRVFAQ